MNAPVKTEDKSHQLIHQNHMWGLWEIASQMTPHPRPEAVPHQWKWSLLKEVVKQSSTAVPVGDERLAMQLFNPGLNGQWATTNTLIAAVQVLLPGEVARAQRHSPAAIRFIIEGHGAYTAVEGEKVIMQPGDFVLTPAWQWHDHGNETNETVVWMDGLDVPLTKALNAMFVEMHQEMKASHGKPVNGSSVFHVVQGRGRSVINGQPFDWEKGDIVALPSWAQHDFANAGNEDAILFSISDRPVLEALGFYREDLS